MASTGILAMVLLLLASQATSAGPVIQEYPIPALFAGPKNITTGPDGSMWFTEYTANQIGRMTTDGVVTAEFPVPTPAGGLHGIVSIRGAVWFTEEIGRIARIDMSGSIEEFVTPTPHSGPRHLVRGPDGNIWFTE